MGIVLGKITVETPKHEVIHTGAGYEIRKYPPCVAAEVTYDPKEMKGNPDGGFTVLANYIGALGKPQNTKPEGDSSEPIAMTAPVVTTGGEGGSSEPIAITAPVITSGAEPEPVAMTAPVITDDQQAPGKVTMQFLLPSKYTKAEEAPRPTDKRVVIRELPERKFRVVKFSGLTSEKTVREKAEGLKAALEKDGFTIKGPFVLSLKKKKRARSCWRGTTRRSHSRRCEPTRSCSPSSDTVASDVLLCCSGTLSGM